MWHCSRDFWPFSDRPVGVNVRNVMDMVCGRLHLSSHRRNHPATPPTPPIAPLLLLLLTSPTTDHVINWLDSIRPKWIYFTDLFFERSTGNPKESEIIFQEKKKKEKEEVTHINIDAVDRKHLNRRTIPRNVAEELFATFIPKQLSKHWIGLHQLGSGWIVHSADRVGLNPFRTGLDYHNKNLNLNWHWIRFEV